MSYPHLDPRDIFGADLIKVFGPKAERRHISTLSYKEKQDILKLLPEYVDTDDCGDHPGDRPSFFQVVNKILTILQQTQALLGIDLDWCDDLSTGKLVRHTSAYIDVAVSYKNNDVQRGVFLRHLVEDILFEFNPTNVLCGLARKLSDGTYNLNNGQHRTIACIILGVRSVPVEYIASDRLSIDVDEYATDNLNTLSASNYDHFRIRVWRNKVRKSEGRTDLDLEDMLMEDIHSIHAQRRSKFVEKGGQNKPLECSSVGNMIKYYKDYGRSIYVSAVDIACTIWNKTALSTGNCWGLMEFLETQRDDKGLSGADIDFKVQQAIVKRYSSAYKSGMHNDIKRVISSDPVFSELDIPERKIIAAGIYKICKTMSPDTNWAPIMWNGKDIAETYLSKYRVMAPHKTDTAAAKAAIAAFTA
jgi:hypothetical protein